ncbi:transposase [Streptosporangium vulgare]|uniref:Transposase n=1 Tax=Streptosporangium vulgare TaxID=46190 RepID=A0ABV5TIC7_9ACTN
MAARGAWLIFADESGQSLRPPKARTWARRGHTPVVGVSAKGSGRISVAALLCLKPGREPRLLYRLLGYHGRARERKGFDVRDFQALLMGAHHLLDAPIVVVWDNLGRHTCARMRAFVGRHDWLMVYQLPSYAPELNPTEGVWANLKGMLGNLAPHSVDELAAAIRSHLKDAVPADAIERLHRRDRPDPRSAVTLAIQDQ